MNPDLTCTRCESDNIAIVRILVETHTVKYVLRCRMCRYEANYMNLSVEKDSARRDIERLIKKVEASGDEKLAAILKKRISKYGSL